MMRQCISKIYHKSSSVDVIQTYLAAIYNCWQCQWVYTVCIISEHFLLEKQNYFSICTCKNSAQRWENVVYIMVLHYCMQSMDNQTRALHVKLPWSLSSHGRFFSSSKTINPSLHCAVDDCTIHLRGLWTIRNSSLCRERTTLYFTPRNWCLYIGNGCLFVLC